MKKTLLTTVILFVFLVGCNSVKTKEKVVNQGDKLNGSWQLNYISGPRIAFDGLYPDKKPTINFDVKENRVSGNNSCNSYTGMLKVDGNEISFKDAKMATTMMACPGQGEQVFMSTLEKIDSYSVSEDGKTLNFIMGDIAMMRFEKQ
jgi:heat shock protein HslJ